MLNRVVVFGVGLIGGSFARALKKSGAVKEIVGIDRSQDYLSRALELGIVDRIGCDVEAALDGADLVMIAAPVAQTGAILAGIKPYLQTHTVVTDAGSTKAGVIDDARAALGEKIAQFVPGHPIAGRETNGPDAAIVDLYAQKKVVLTPLPENTPESIEKVVFAWQACGANIHYLTAQEHDCAFASVSHLPHLLAYVLVDNIVQKPESDLLFEFAASGFRDFTRIAGSSPEMWRDITLANRDTLLAMLDSYSAHLSKMRDFLAKEDGEAIYRVYASAQQARQNWINTIELGETLKKEGEEQ